MKIKHFSKLSVSIVCLTVALFFTLTAACIALANDDQVKIGVLAKRGIELCLEKWSPTAKYLTDKIPCKTFVIIPLEHEQVRLSVKKGEIDFILANSSFYVELEYQHGANRIATLKNWCFDNFYTEYWGVIFWKADRSDMRRINDLKGKSFAATAEGSFGGWRMGWRELKEKGINRYRDFKYLKFCETQDAVVYAVRDGEADAGTVRSDTFLRMHNEGKIDIQNFYVVHEQHGGEVVNCPPFPHSTRGYPEWPMAKLKHTPDKLAKEVAVALLEMPADSPAAIAAECGGWTIPMNYQSVHECLKYLKVEPYKDFGKITLTKVFKNYWYWFLSAAIIFVVMLGFIIAILRLNWGLSASRIRLEKEVSFREQAEIDLIKTKKAAESATEAKSSFLANMSHEIRTPMNGIIAAADLALSEDLPPKISHYLEIIQSSAYSLLELINDILDFSKVEAGRIDLESRPFMLDVVMDRVTDMFIKKASEKNIEFLVDMDLKTPNALTGDSLRLQQIIKNLVDNAIKFTKKGGIILVGVKALEEPSDQVTLAFFVKDTGVGIAPEDLCKLFKPFSQADVSTARKYAGTGLGLSICKQLVELMGGKIWVESDLGKGSTFHFTVVFKRRDKGHRRRLMPPLDIQKLKILVVDDRPDSRAIMQKMLESFGFNLELVSSGEEAIDMLYENHTMKEPFDLVIIDWRMPEMDGIEASRIIRQDLKLTIPIIMMTAFGREAEKLEAKKAGINTFLTKPIFQSTIFNAIMDAFGKESRETRPCKEITTKASIYKKHLKGVKILVAEDNPTNQEIAKAILEGAGIIIEIVNNGEEAVEAARKGRFDAVLMDVQMPKMDGYEATANIRKIPELKSLPIIAMTAHAMKGDEEKCLEAGMDAYISKPINQDRLFHTIWKTIKSQKGLPDDKESETVVQKEAMDTSVVATEVLPAKLPGINIQDALKALDIGADVFKRILIGFLRNNKDVSSNIKDLFDKKDWESLMHLAHSLKGSAGNIGAVDLQEAAFQLEKASSKGAPGENLADNVAAALNQVLESLQSLADMEKSEPSDVKAGSVDPAKVMLLLKQLADALELADPEEINSSFIAVKKHLDFSTYQELENRLNDYDYGKALKSLEEIASKMDRRLK
ncbi:MAG: response regulator [Candidatus Desulfaltia sp.]|nr:response regulator [Candidatus Desulfaltia sp.]